MASPQAAMAWPKAPRASLSRRYMLSASHRLHSERMSERENREAYGKCNNPYGHGHNYVVEVTYAGRVDAMTGMVCDLAALDAFAQEHLLERFDRSNLNVMAEFEGTVPTTENFAAELGRIFAAFPSATLTRLRVEETTNNAFEYVPPGRDVLRGRAVPPGRDAFSSRAAEREKGYPVHGSSAL